MKYIWTKIAALLLMVSLLCTFSVTVYAHDVPDESKKGSVTVKMQYDGKAVTGGVLALYKIGAVHEDDGDYTFEKTGVFSRFDGELTDLDSAVLADSLADFVKLHSVKPDASVKNEDGKAVFKDMELGLYLVVQLEAAEGFELLNPFLVSVPMIEDGRYIYDIDAQGKSELKQEPKPVTPENPPETDLPHTGQINWPVPVMAVFGIILLLTGLILRSHKGEKKYAK